MIFIVCTKGLAMAEGHTDDYKTPYVSGFGVDKFTIHIHDESGSADYEDYDEPAIRATMPSQTSESTGLTPNKTTSLLLFLFFLLFNRW